MDNEALQRLVSESLGGCCWELNPDSNHIVYSDEFMALIGYRPGEQAVDLPWVSDNIHPKDLSQWREAYVEHVKGNSQYFDCELRFRHKQDYYLWIQTRGRAIERDKDGRATRIVGVVFDISESKSAKDVESRYRLFLDNIPDAISLKDRKGRYLYVNHQFESWIGKPSYQIYGLTAEQIFQWSREQLAPQREHEARVWETRQTISMERRFPTTDDGLSRQTVITKFPVFDETGEMLAVGTTNTDVTDRHDAEAAIRASEIRYRRLFESAPVVLAETDWSEGRALIEDLRKRGVSDLKQYLLDHPELLHRQDQVLKVLSVNHEALRVFGMEDEAELVEFAEGKLNSEKRISLIDELVNLASGQRRSTVRSRQMHRDGTSFPIVRVAEIFSLDPEDWSQVLISIQDTSAEEAVRMSEIRYRRLFESAPVALAETNWSRGKALIDSLREQGVVNLKTHLLEHPQLLARQDQALKILSVNNEALRIFGAHNQSALIENAEGEIDDERRGFLIDELTHFANGQRRSRLRCRHRRLNGEAFPVYRVSEMYSPHRDDWSQVLVSIQDTSAEEAVRMSEVRYRRLFESAPAALFEADWSQGKALVDRLRAQDVDDIRQYLLDHPEMIRRRDELLTIVNCNQEALRIYRYESNEDMIEAIEGELTPDRRAALIEALANFASGMRRSSVRTISQRSNGDSFHMMRDSELISSDREDWSRVLTVVHDLTEEVETTERLERYQQELRTLAGKISLAEESERRRISSELHDGTIQNLVLARIHLARLRELLESGSAETLAQDVDDLLESSLKDTRSLIFEISPPILYELGLEPAVEWLAEHYRQRTGVEVRIDNDQRETRLSQEMKIVVFQAARELLVNIAKHAEAARVSLEWRHDDDSLELKLRDDGVGFKPDGVRVRGSEGGFGLFSIRERLNLLGADIDIQSSDEGTEVSITAPADNR